MTETKDVVKELAIAYSRFANNFSEKGIKSFIMDACSQFKKNYDKLRLEDMKSMLNGYLMKKYSIQDVDSLVTFGDAFVNDYFAEKCGGRLHKFREKVENEALYHAFLFRVKEIRA